MEIISRSLKVTCNFIHKSSQNEVKRENKLHLNKCRKVPFLALETQVNKVEPPLRELTVQREEAESASKQMTCHVAIRALKGVREKRMQSDSALVSKDLL